MTGAKGCTSHFLLLGCGLGEVIYIFRQDLRMINFVSRMVRFCGCLPLMRSKFKP